MGLISTNIKGLQQLVLGMHGPLSAEQWCFYTAPARYNFVICGSKAGKTFGFTEYFCGQAWGKPNRMLMWCAPYKAQVDYSFRMACKILPEPYRRVNRQERTIELLNGSVIRWVAVDRDPEIVEGAGNDIILLDEASKMKVEVYHSAKTTISATGGRLVATTTPRGKRHWTYSEYSRAMAGTMGYHAVNLPTFINPTVDIQTIEDQKIAFNEDSYAQYILAQFVDGSGSEVFRKLQKSKVDPCSVAWQTPRPGRVYIIGVDLARVNDYSVITVIDATRYPEHDLELVDFIRFPHADWDYQKRRVIEIHGHYNNGMVVMDATGVGQPIAEDIKRQGVPVHEYVLNNRNKSMLIQRLQITFEENRLKIPDLEELHYTLFNELESYEYTLTRSGEVGYSAPDDGVTHDDSVMSLALANFGANNLLGGTTLRDLGVGKDAGIPREKGSRRFRRRSKGPRRKEY